MTERQPHKFTNMDYVPVNFNTRAQQEALSDPRKALLRIWEFDARAYLSVTRSDDGKRLVHTETEIPAGFLVEIARLGVALNEQRVFECVIGTRSSRFEEVGS